MNKKLVRVILLTVLFVLALSLKSLAVFITDMNSNAEFGIIEGSYQNYGHQLHYCTYDGKTYMLFCTQFGVKSPTGREYAYNDEFVLEYKYNFEKYQKLAEMVYLGYTMDYGTGLPTSDAAKSAMCCTQQYVWEYIKNNIDSNAKVVGRDSWNTKYMTSAIYANWLEKTEALYDEYHSDVSFNATSNKLNIGEKVTLVDSNGALKNYGDFSKTINGITFLHTRGSNELTISSSNESNSGVVNFNSKDYSIYKLIPNGNSYNSSIMSSYIYFKFNSDTVQNLLFSNYINPNNFNITVELQAGSILVKKLNNMNNPISNCKFELYSDKECLNKILDGVSSDTGQVLFEKIKPGIYYVKEVTASAGYFLENEIKQVEVIDGKETIVEFVNEEPTGAIAIIKQDNETDSIPQGDASFENAKYALYANEDIYNVAKTKKYYSKGDLVITKTMDSKGKTEMINDLPLGKYMVKEIEAPIGYMLDTNEYEVNLEYKDQDTPLVTAVVTSKEKVKKRKVHIFKSGIKNYSGVVPGLKGITFTIKLKSDVQKALDKGYTYEEIWNTNEIVKAYAIVTTDVEGNAYTDYLPYGEYILKETRNLKDYETIEDFIFEIKEDESEINDVNKKVKQIVINNIPIEAYLRIIKKDKDTGKIITASNTIFQIKAKEDILDRVTGKVIYKANEFVSQKIGNTEFVYFSTNAKNLMTGDSYINLKDELGSVVTPLTLPIGKYELIEYKAPEGFLQLNDSVEFEIENILKYEKLEDGSYIKEIVIENEQPKTELVIEKTIEVSKEADTSLLDTTDLSKIEFELTAKDDVVSCIDDTVIYKAGEKIDTYNLDEEGKLKIEDLPIGNYELKEKKTLDGLVLEDIGHEIELIDSIKKEIINYPTIVEFSKTSITGTEELVGARLDVIDASGKIIDSWYSTDKRHRIEGLIVGNTYVLKEIIPPEGYELAEEISFMVQNTKEVQLIQMKDKPTKKEEPPKENLPPCLPKTGDEIIIFIILLIENISFIFLVILQRKSK